MVGTVALHFSSSPPPIWKALAADFETVEKDKTIDDEMRAHCF